MKYLKLFNENVENFKEELQEFCEMNLAYILDDGGEIEVVDPHNTPGMDVARETYLIKIKADSSFNSEYIPDPDVRENFGRWNWDEIKDHIIPFLTRLNNTYELSNFTNCTKYCQTTGWSKSKGNIRFYIIYNNEEPRTTGFFSYITDLVENFIEERTKYDYDSFKIYELCIGIKGYKGQNEIPKKKGILTKIKSFFK